MLLKNLNARFGVRPERQKSPDSKMLEAVGIAEIAKLKVSKFRLYWAILNMVHIVNLQKKKLTLETSSGLIKK